MEENKFEYFAFISYNSKDISWGKKLQRKLEHYSLPATICSSKGWKRRPLKPIFFAPTDIQPGGLNEELQRRLRVARHLIVVCSPDSAQSEWVGKEIEYFFNLGRRNNIHFFIVRGVPHSGNPENECFNPIVQSLGMPEYLGANIHEKVYKISFLNKERAFIQLVSKLLGVEYDSLWHRHRRFILSRLILRAFVLASVVLSFLTVRQRYMPVDVAINIEESSPINDHLPGLSNATISLHLDDEIKAGVLPYVGTSLHFSNIPRRFVGGKTRVRVECDGFADIDSVIVLQKSNCLMLKRNLDVYGSVRFTVWNPHLSSPMPGVKVTVQGIDAISDENGTITLTVPLADQRTVYRIVSETCFESDSLFMPSGPDDFLIMR